MSVYSGFAMRHSEQQYNQLVQLLLITLSKRLIKVYIGEYCNEKAFKETFAKIVKGMRDLEQIKYLEPKFTDSIINLEQHLEIQVPIKKQHNQLFLPESLQTNQTPVSEQSSFNKGFPAMSSIRSVRTKKQRSSSMPKRKELEFRQLLLVMDEELDKQNLTTKYLIRQPKKI